jgi:hypothetical protein
VAEILGYGMQPSAWDTLPVCREFRNEMWAKQKINTQRTINLGLKNEEAFGEEDGMKKKS